MQVELLGPPGLVRDGHRLPLPGRQQALLVVLALAAPRPVPRDRLVDVLWGDERPADPANALHQRVSALRKVLDPGRHGEVLVTTGGGYALQLDDEAIDARRFDRLARGGAQLLALGDAAGATTELQAALSLWRGNALEGIADEGWARADAVRLEELRLAATEDLHDAALATGAGAGLVGELSDLHARHPLRERPAGQLMLALCRAGRQADALDVYDRTRRQLADELGVDPGPALQRVYRMVLDQAEETAPATPAVRPAVGPGIGVTSPDTTGPTTRVDNLPAPTAGVIGRDVDLSQLDGLLADARCLTLTGPGGTGKTTLAIELARRRPRPPHGTWLVELAALADGDALAGHVAAVLGVGATGMGAAEVGVDVLAAVLRDRRLLLVLDNAEHLVEAVCGLVTPLLAAAPGLRLLVTSREPLGLPGEQLWAVPPLDVPAAGETDRATITATAAVRLLCDRARRYDPWFDLDTGDIDTVATLVRQLDGIPLAIELAAAQLRVRSLPELAADLDDRLSLASSQRAVPARQRTLRGALDWSWDLLDIDQRRGWAALSVAAAPLDRDAAGRLVAAAGVTAPAAEVLRDLVDRSLLTVARRDGVTRFDQLTTLRAYGHERLVELGLVDPVEEAHAALVEDGLDRALGGARDPARFTVDIETLAEWLGDARVVLARATAANDRARIQRVAGRLGWVWLLRGLASEGLGWLDRGLGPLDEIDPATVDPTAALWASGLRVGRAHTDASGWAALAVTAQQRPDEEAVALVFAAVHALHAGDLATSTRRFVAARAAADPIGGWPLGFTRLVAAQLGRLTGRLTDDVRDDAEAALGLLGGEGLAWAQGLAIDILVDVALDREGDAATRRARDLAVEGLRRCADHDLPELESRLRLQLARALHALGQVETAQRQAEVGVRLAERVGQDVALGFAVLIAGRLARERGELDEALGQLRRARELLAGSSAPFGIVEANVEVGLTALAGHDLASAAAAGATAAAIAEEVGEPALIARAGELMGAIRSAEVEDATHDGGGSIGEAGDG